MNDWNETEQLKTVGGRALSEVMGDPPPGFLFENCFRDQSITVFVAPPHRGKTLMMLDMAICLDLELPLFGRFTPLPGRRMFWLAADAPSWDYGLQSRKLCIGHGLDASHRKMLNIPGIWKAGPKITDQDTLDWLRSWKNLTGTDVLFIDTHRATHSADENNSQEMEKVWNILKRLRDEGWCIIMSHHTSKPTEVLQEDVNTARGSSVIGASADFIYTLNKRNRKDPRVQVRMVKGRGAADDEDPFSHFEITPIPSDEILNGRPLYGLRLVASSEDASAALLLAMKDGPKDRVALSTALRAACPELTAGMSDTQVYRTVDNRLVELRQLNKIRSIARGVWGLSG